MRRRKEPVPEATGEAQVLRQVQQATQQQLQEAQEVRREIDEKARKPMEDASTEKTRPTVMRRKVATG